MEFDKTMSDLKNVPFSEQSFSVNDSTIDYYNKNAILFSDETFDVNMMSIQDTFLNLLSANGTILDFGCGAGRDSKYFLSKGFTVEAMDGSSELCKIASKNTGLQVINTTFQEYSSKKNNFDGVWACSSILHVAKSELPSIFSKIEKILKQNGIFYASFKYGLFEGKRNDRFFTDFTQESFIQFLSSFNNSFRILQILTTQDVRANRQNEKWLNIFLQKQ